MSARGVGHDCKRERQQNRCDLPAHKGRQDYSAENPGKRRGY